MTDETTKLFALSILYLALFVIEHYLPYFKNRQQHLQHAIKNICLAVLSKALAVFFFVLILGQIFAWAKQQGIGLLPLLDLPPVWNYVLAFILIDLWQYLWHRLNHTFAFLWRFHQVHHTDKEMDASTGIRFHPIEILYSDIARLAVIPIVGIQIEHLLIYELVLLPIVLFHHSNIRFSESLDRWLRIFIVTPHIHRLHHSDIKAETDSNYASVFSVWDRLFNSYSMREIINHFNLGLGNQFSNSQWNQLTGMLKLPFVKISPS